MFGNEWGSVNGDSSADGIIRDRRRDKTTLAWTNIVCGLPFIPCLIWYALTGSKVALALIFFELAGIVHAAVENGIFQTHTFTMIAESRARELELQVQRLEELVTELKRQHPTY